MTDSIEIKMKNKGWHSHLKEYYQPEDVLRYYYEVREIKTSSGIEIRPPEDFFTDDVLKKGLNLLNVEKIKEVKARINYLRQIELPKLEAEFSNLLKK
jgi:hypothetical protein